MKLINKPSRDLLFKVRDKQNEKRPDWKGGVNVKGVEYELAAWETVSERGTPYLSLSISPPRDRATTINLGQTADFDQSFPAPVVNNTKPVVIAKPPAPAMTDEAISDATYDDLFAQAALVKLSYSGLRQLVRDRYGVYLSQLRNSQAAALADELRERLGSKDSQG